MSEFDVKEFILNKRSEGKIVTMTYEGLASIDMKIFLDQPADGILYDLNRLEEVSLTYMDMKENVKWINDFAVALTIRELKSQVTRLGNYAQHRIGCEFFHSEKNKCDCGLETQEEG
jgi:hypothetical protein